MLEDPGGLRSGNSGLPRPSVLLGQAKDAGSHKWILRGGVPRILGGDPGGPAVPHHFQCVGGHSGVSLDLVGGGRCGREGRWGGGGLLHRATFIYRDDGLVAPMDPFWLQGSFDTLTRIFDRVGIRKNVRKTVGMLCRPCCTVGTQSETAYERQMTEE